MTEADFEDKIEEVTYEGEAWNSTYSQKVAVTIS
jgi:hypothetical protein